MKVLRRGLVVVLVNMIVVACLLGSIELFFVSGTATNQLRTVGFGPFSGRTSCSR